MLPYTLVSLNGRLGPTTTRSVLLPHVLQLLVAGLLKRAFNGDVQLLELGSQLLVHGEQLVNLGISHPLRVHLAFEWATIR